MDAWVRDDHVQMTIQYALERADWRAAGELDEHTAAPSGTATVGEAERRVVWYRSGLPEL